MGKRETRKRSDKRLFHTSWLSVLLNRILKGFPKNGSSWSDIIARLASFMVRSKTKAWPLSLEVIDTWITSPYVENNRYRFSLSVFGLI